MTIFIKRHWLTIALALITAILLFGFFHRCANHGSRGQGGSLTPSVIVDGSTTPTSPTTPATITSWLASLDWEAIGMGVGGLVSGLGMLYQIVLKWRKGSATIEAVIDQSKTLFHDVKAVETAFKSPVSKMDQPVTMAVPKSESASSQ